jgi:twinkle protein
MMLVWNHRDDNDRSSQRASLSTLASTSLSSSLSVSYPSCSKSHNNNNNNNYYIQSMQKRTKVFVSRHNDLNVTATTILDYCTNQTNVSSPKAKTSPTHVILRECPFCSKPTQDKPSNLYKLYIEIGSGAHFCHRCGASGSWYDFKAQLGGFRVESSLGGGDTMTSTSTSSSSAAAAAAVTMGRGNAVEPAAVAALPMPQARLSGYYSSRLLDPQNSDNSVLTYLVTVRGLDRKTLRKYGVGRATYKFPSDQPGAAVGYVDAECVSFPWIMRESELQTQEDSRRGTTTSISSKAAAAAKPKGNGGTKPKKKKEDSNDDNNNNEEEEEDAFVTRRIKVRAVEQKAWQRLDPPGGGWGLFGLHTVPDDANEIILTEGEYDAMAVSQATGRPAVSLPNGCRSLPVHVLPLLERFDKIYLWMDNDAPGQEGAEKFAKKLGLNRCFIVKCKEAKDANDALLQGVDMDALLDQASLVPHDRILTFADLRTEVLHELFQPDLYTGSPIPSLPTFTGLIKGFRRGEMTVLTGPTGSGKVRIQKMEYYAWSVCVCMFYVH